jgi:mucin-19
VGDVVSNFTDFIGGGAATLETIVLTTSQTWTPPANGTARIHVIGGGGSGGSNTQGYSGSAGGYCRKDVTLSTGTNWTIVVGSGGTPTGSNQGTQAGGNSSATDGSSTLTANGATPSGFTSVPGTASGGDVNYTGGQGSNGNVFPGGGAVSVHSSGGGDAAFGGGGTSDAGVDGFVPLGLGQLIGGSGGNQGHAAGNGRFLSGGGGALRNDSNTLVVGGNGGIGAGGGHAWNGSSSSQRVGGRGGDGIVIVQYLTVS